jgi:hypothetical protein
MVMCHISRTLSQRAAGNIGKIIIGAAFAAFLGLAGNVA